MSLQPIIMTKPIAPPKPKQRIEETLAEAKGSYALQPVYVCDQCPLAFTTRVGLREHKLLHGLPPANPISRYVVPGKYVDLFCQVSEAEIMRSKEQA
jgi:hypothetical protein